MIYFWHSHKVDKRRVAWRAVPSWEISHIPNLLLWSVTHHVLFGIALSEQKMKWSGVFILT